MMNLNETVINVIFDAGRGTLSVESREATVGKPFGKLPTPTRQGYAFNGWYLEGALVAADTVVTAEDDIRLVARWTKVRQINAPKSSYKKQKIAIAVLSLVTLILIGVVVLVKYGVSVYRIEDKWTIDGVEYTENYYIKKKDGVYGLYDKDGNLMEINALSTYNMSNGSDTPYVVYIAKTSGNQYLIDSSTGNCRPYAVVDYGGYEQLGFRDRILMYPQITSTYVFSIEVSNEYGSYKFYRDKNGNVKLEGFEDSPATYDYAQFVSLCNACGYTITLERLDMKSEDSGVARLPDGSVDYEAYGLADVYENGELVYSPTVFTIVKANYNATTGTYSESETRYTVKVGNPLLSQTGYYMQLEGRDTIYIGDTAVEETVLQPIESMMVPTVVHSTTVNTYLSIENFQLGKIPGAVQDFDPEKPDQAGKPIVSFTSQELDERLSTIFTVSPYISYLDIMEGYTLHDSNVSQMLLLLYQLQDAKCIKLGFDGAALAKYGLDKDVYYMVYNSPATDSNGKQVGINYNAVLISQKTKNNTYYVASFVSDMILEVDAAYFAFLEWDESDWYHESFFQYDISYVPEFNIQIGDKSYNFTLSNLLSYGYYENAAGKILRVDLTKKENRVHQDSQGRWIYTDANGIEYPLRVFDFSKGDLYIKVTPKGESAIYHTYYKYLLTKDRNNKWELTVITKDAGQELVYRYDLGSNANENYSYKLVYVDGNGEEFDVAGAYNDAQGNRISSPYVLTYWEEIKGTAPNGTTTYTWQRQVTQNLGTSIILRTTTGPEESRKLYQIPVVSTNLKASCEQGSLDYNKAYQYKTDMGTIETAIISGTDNFRELFAMLLNYSLEGTIDTVEFEKTWGMSVSEYIAQKPYHAQFSYTIRDMSSNMNIITVTGSNASEKKPTWGENAEQQLWYEHNEMHIVARLYQYSPTRSILTISVDGGEEIGVFYVQTSYCDEILEAAEKLLAQIPIAPEGEYIG